MPWCFAIINNKLAEIYFEKKKGKIKIEGHCYVKKEEFKTRAKMDKRRTQQTISLFTERANIKELKQNSIYWYLKCGK